MNPTDAELVGGARELAESLRRGEPQDDGAVDLVATLASRLEALSAARRERDERCWKAGDAYGSRREIWSGNSVWEKEKRMDTDLAAIDAEEK